jgi:hypothetical protein
LIAEIAADLLAKVQSVAGLETSAGLSIGGRSQDPGLLKVPLPAAWCSLKTDQTDEQDYTHGPGSGLILPSQRMMGTWAVMVFIPYIDDADLLATQFPLLEAVANAVHGTTTPSGFAWRYIGQRIALVYPDRLAYEQRFTLHYALNSDPITT